MKNILYSLLIIIFSTSCSKNKIKQVDNSKFVTNWFDTISSYPYSSILKIKRNNTFEYNQGTCMYSSMSNGTWLIKNDTLILNSKNPDDFFFS